MHTPASKFGPPGELTTHVIYFVAGPKVYVSSTPGFAGAPMYLFLSANEISDNSSCKYRRM